MRRLASGKFIEQLFNPATELVPLLACIRRFYVPNDALTTLVVQAELLNRTAHRHDVLDIFDVVGCDPSGRSVADIDIDLLHRFNNLVMDALGRIDSPEIISPSIPRLAYSRSARAAAI